MKNRLPHLLGALCVLCVYFGAASAANFTATNASDANFGTITAAVAANVGADAATNANAAPVSADNAVALAPDFLVTTAADTTPDGCTPADCTLREAILATNALASGTPTIGFDSAVFGTAQTIALSASLGPLTINRNVSISGTGANLTSVSGGDAIRVFIINAGTVTLDALTVQDGRAGTGSGGISIAGTTAIVTLSNAVVTGSSGSFGGGISNAGELTLRNVTVSDNAASQRGGGISNNGTLTVNDSSLINNSSSSGGGIHNESGKTLTLNSTTVRDGTATNSGGGIFNGNGSVTLNDSTVKDNTAAGSGSAISSGGSGAVFALNNSSVTGGTATGNAAIINVGGTMTLTDSIVSGYTLNVTSSGGTFTGGISNNSGATLNLIRSTVSGNTVNAAVSSDFSLIGGINSAGALNLTDSTISGNTTTGGGVTAGGVILNTGTGAALTLTNSTVSGNRALNGVNSTTGGIRILGGSNSITNSTVTDNEAVGSAFPTSGVYAGGTTNIRNSVIADNRNSTSVTETRSTFTSQGYNYIGNAGNSSGWITTGANADVINAPAGAARLGALADNGGATRTHALWINSPLINKADPNNVLPTDQRGTARPQGTLADIGAFEYEYTCTGAAFSITNNPQSVTARAGQPLSFSVGLTTNVPYQIQWQITTNAGASWTDIAGANDATLDLGNADIYDTYNNVAYRAVATPACGPARVSFAATVSVLPATGGGAVCAPLSARASAWFRGADNATDFIGGASGTPQNGAGYDIGKFGRGFKFDGQNDFVFGPSSAYLAPRPQVSVEAWVNFRNLDSTRFGGAPAGLQYLVFKKNTRTSNFEGYALVKERGASGDNFVFVLADRDGAQIKAVSSAAINTDEWYHVVGTFDGASAKLYVNGQLAGETDAGANFAGLDYDNSPVYFGASRQISFDGYLNGFLDEVKIYSQALTSSAVRTNYSEAGTCLANRWTGATSSDWGNAANWSAGAVPTSTQTAYIFSGAGNSPTISNNVSVLSLNLSSGRSLFVNPGASLAVSGVTNVEGNLTVLGSYIPGGAVSGLGSVNFSASSPQIIPSQTYSRVAFSGGNKTLAGDVTITNSLNFNNQLIEGKGSRIIFEPNATWTRSGGYALGEVEKQFGAGAGSFAFPVGTARGYSPVAVSNVAGAGSLTVSAFDGAYSGATNLPTNRAARWWNLSNSGLTSADLQFTYLPGDITLGTESDYKIFRIRNGTAQSLGGTIDTTGKTISIAGVTQFSDWTLAEALAPTAANVSVGGRVLTHDGRGVYKALVTITDADGNTRYAVTNPFGFYRFADMAAGATYVVSASHKQFSFAAQVVSVTDEAAALNFVAAPK